MKTQDLILDILGLIIVLLSLWGYFFQGFDFYESTIIGCVGLALFVLKGSKIRSFVEKIINKYLDK